MEDGTNTLERRSSLVTRKKKQESSSNCHGVEMEDALKPGKCISMTTGGSEKA